MKEKQGFAFVAVLLINVCFCYPKNLLVSLTVKIKCGHVYSPTHLSGDSYLLRTDHFLKGDSGELHQHYAWVLLSLTLQSPLSQYFEPHQVVQEITWHLIYFKRDLADLEALEGSRQDLLMQHSACKHVRQEYHYRPFQSILVCSSSFSLSSHLYKGKTLGKHVRFSCMTIERRWHALVWQTNLKLIYVCDVQDILKCFVRNGTNRKLTYLSISHSPACW